MMTREMEFRMERAGLIQVGDQVRLKEDVYKRQGEHLMNLKKL